MRKFLIAMLLVVSCATVAQTYDSSKSARVTVRTKTGHTCEFTLYGSDKPTKEEINQQTELCEREERGQAILGITGLTNRDFSNMSPQQKQAYRCNMVRQKIETQKDLEAAGSSGFYNMDNLRQLEAQECGSRQ